jgi:hypothetical protein
MTCAICETRRPRRACPGVNGDICAICCGTEREVTVSCPLDCEYLQEARRREPVRDSVPEELPNSDVQVTERLIRDNEDLLNTLGRGLVHAALQVGAVDADAHEALAALARTYRTLQSGVFYATRPNGAFAAALYDAVQQVATQFREEEKRRGVTHTRDADLLGILVFLQQVEHERSNGRPRGRAFIDALRGHYETSASVPSPERSSLLLP